MPVTNFVSEPTTELAALPTGEFVDLAALPVALVKTLDVETLELVNCEGVIIGMLGLTVMLGRLSSVSDRLSSNNGIEMVAIGVVLE